MSVLSEETDHLMNIQLDGEVICRTWDRVWIIVVGIEKITITCRSFTNTSNFKQMFHYLTR
jgi:hypothetical protein